MPENKRYLPEGLSHRMSDITLPALREAMEAGSILEAPVQRCDAKQTLHIPLGSVDGRIPREEVLSPWISGAEREISILTRVGKPACFVVKGIHADERGAPVADLSRREVQEQALAYFLENLKPGSVVSARVTHLAAFGAFLDIGCGVTALLPIEHISVARISHPRDRFHPGQKILAVVHSVDREKRRFTMTHKELLGTWLENASWFQPGETVAGIVRGVKEYGSFIELTPNLSGLTETREGLSPGMRVSVYIKSLRPERMKIKLQIIEQLPPAGLPESLHYQITDGILERWCYSPPNYEGTPVETVFQQETLSPA